LDGVGLPDAADANMLAAVFILVIPYILLYFYKSKPSLKIIFMFLLVFIVNAFAMTKSRGGILGLFASIIVICWYLRGKENFKKLFLYITVFFAFTILSMDNEFITRVTKLSEGSVTEQSAGRFEIWMSGLDIFFDYPFGVGPGGFQVISENYVPLRIKEGKVRASHNTYLQVLTELGVIGIILYLLFIRSFFVENRKSLSLYNEHDPDNAFHPIALKSGFIGFLVASFFIDRLFFEGIYIYVAINASLSNILSTMYEA